MAGVSNLMTQTAMVVMSMALMTAVMSIAIQIPMTFPTIMEIWMLERMMIRRAMREETANN